jgi:Fe-S-cluster containining protein
LAETNSVQLHLPDGINYECTGCGKCCGGWAVPMTEVDYERISKVDWGERLPKFQAATLYRPLKDYEKQGTPYTHAIKENATGQCPFVVDNLCFIHSQFESETKPSICQLFPYSFNETPSGVYATVSFVSMGVIHNSGKPLVEQRDYMMKKFSDFQTLYPGHHPNWAKLEMTNGKPISWDEYLVVESEIVSSLQNRELSLEERFRDASKKLLNRVKGAPPATAAATAEVRSSSGLKPLDHHLLLTLHRMYFPTKLQGRGDGDFKVMRFLQQIAFKGISNKFRVALPSAFYTLGDLSAVAWDDKDPDIENLLYRYFYSRIFAKLYFGAGFGQLTVITGFHHLGLLYALVKMQSKALALSRGVNKVSYVDVVAAIRQLEKRMGETSVDGMAAAAFELLMFSPSRLDRILAAA